MGKYKDKDWLIQKYHNEDLKQSEIAGICNVAPKTIRRWLKRFGIRYKTKGEYRKCKNCGEKYYIYPSAIKRHDPKYCSRECSRQGEIRHCSICGKKLYIYPSQIEKNLGEYCKDCYDTHRKEILGKESNCICDYCGNAFRIKPSHIENGEGKYCSLACKSAAGRVNTSCQVCGKTFSVNLSQVERYQVSYCSLECKSKSQMTGKILICPVCGDEFYRKPSEMMKSEVNYCSISCASSANMKSRWLNGDNDDIYHSPTSIELKTAEGLMDFSLEFDQEWRPDNYTRIYDFLVYPNVLIEVQGDYWHSRDGQKMIDLEKAKWAFDNNFILVEFWEHEINEVGAHQLIQERIFPILR